MKKVSVFNPDALLLEGCYDLDYLGNYSKFLYRDEINGLFFIIGNTEVYEFNSEEDMWVVLTYSKEVLKALSDTYGKHHLVVNELEDYTQVNVTSDLITLLNVVNVKKLQRKSSRDFSDLEKRFAHKILEVV